MTQRAWTLKKQHWDEMPQMLRKQHWTKNLLQQEGVSETLSHWKTVKWRTSHRQLASLKGHWSKRTGQRPDKGHEQGMFRNSLEKSGPILLWLRVTMWKPKQSTKPNKLTMAPVVADNERRGQGTPRQRDLGPSETTHRQTRQMGLQSEIETQWSSRQIQNTLCGESFKQVEGLDYFETFAPTCKPETLRILIQLSAKQGHVMHQFDVKTAFLH